MARIVSIPPAAGGGMSGGGMTGIKPVQNLTTSTKGVWLTALDVTGSGFLETLYAYIQAGNAFCTVQIRVTVDGAVISHTAMTVANSVGFRYPSPQAIALTDNSLQWGTDETRIRSMRLPFKNSLKLEIHLQNIPELQSARLYWQLSQ